MDTENTIPYLEQREFPRLVDNIFISYHSKSGVFKAITENIGGGGLMFESEKKLPVGATLEMEVYQPANSFKTLIYVIPVVIKIAWNKRIKYDFLEMGENAYRIGVSFVKITDEDRGKIIGYVQKKVA